MTREEQIELVARIMCDSFNSEGTYDRLVRAVINCDYPVSYSMTRLQNYQLIAEKILIELDVV